MKTQSMRILMVDDDPDDAELTRFFLRREGLRCEIERVDNRQALEQALHARLPAAILCDLSLPSFSSLEALDIARRLAPKIPFIIFSGSTHGPAIDEVRARGLTKIFSKDNCKHIASLLGKIAQRCAVHADINNFAY